MLTFFVFFFYFRLTSQAWVNANIKIDEKLIQSIKKYVGQSF